MGLNGVMKATRKNTGLGSVAVAQFGQDRSDGIFRLILWDPQLGRDVQVRGTFRQAVENVQFRA